MQDPDFFTNEQQQLIAINHAKLITENMNIWQFENLSDPTQELLRPFIFENGSPKLLVDFLLTTPTLFTTEQQNYIILNHGKLIFDTNEYELSEKIIHLPKTVQRLLGNFFFKNGSQELLIKLLLGTQTLFTEKEQYDIFTRNIDLILSNAEFYHLGTLTDPLKELLIAALINKKDFILMLKFMIQQPQLFTPQKNQEFLLKNKDTILKEHAFLIKTFIDVLDENSKTVFINSLSAEEQKNLTLQLSLANLTPRKRLIVIPKEIPSELKFSSVSEEYKTIAHYQDTYSELLELSHTNGYGPFFSNYVEKNPLALLEFLPFDNPHFYNLIPVISEYVKNEYENNRIVFFHGQRADWLFFRELYNELYHLKNNSSPSEYFIPLRFRDQTALSEKDIETIRQEGTFYSPGAKNTEEKDSLFFATLHPAANAFGGNPLAFAHSNADCSRGREDFFDTILLQIFKNLDLSQEYDALKNESPETFKELYKLSMQATQEQGDHGPLLVISMPKKLTQKIAYSCDDHGTPLPLSIKETLTTDPVEIAHNFDHVPEEHQCCLILTQELLNQEAAKKAEVRMVSFDPAFYWGTEKSLQAKKEIKKIAQRIMALYEKNKKEKS